jgi:pimeloyl-ACP methyl ester carboxylesterase
MADEQGFSDFFYTASDGLQLHARLYGEAHPDLWPVVCLPGLTRNCRDFHELALYLSTRAKIPRRVVAFDYRGRGQSAYDPDIKNYNVITEAGDVLAGLDALGIPAASFIGTSRGGLIIHILGAMRPAMLKAIVLNDIGPVIEATGLAHIAAYLDRSPTLKAFADAVQSQRATHGADFPALTDADWERMVRALYREAGDGWLPDFDPALVKTLADIDFSAPLPTLWPQFDALAAVPMLTLRGSNSGLLSEQTVEEMRKRHPEMQTIFVEGQGHAPFLETGTLPREIAVFFDRSEEAEQNVDRQRLSTSANR